MPLYEYSCRSCEHSFEVLSSGNRSEPLRCPECDGAEVDRLIGLPAKGRTADPASNCRGDGPPCGAPWCGRQNLS
jgi:putative FmdB family regulatory protein